MVVLERNWVGVVTPVGEIVGKLERISVSQVTRWTVRESYCPLSPPFDCHILQCWMQSRRNPVRLVFGENDGTSIATLFERRHNIGDVVMMAPVCSHGADIVVVFHIACMANGGQPQEQERNRSC